MFRATIALVISTGRSPTTNYQRVHEMPGDTVTLAAA